MAVKVSPAFIGLAERAITPASAPFGYGEVTIQEQGQFGFIMAQKTHFYTICIQSYLMPVCAVQQIRRDISPLRPRRLPQLPFQLRGNIQCNVHRH